MSANFDLSKILKNNTQISRSQRLKYVCFLSIPGILAQISSILMQYIDAAMVGSLGQGASASIGLVASSTWVMGSLCHAISIGFTVQVAHAVGEGNRFKAKNIFKQSILTAIVFSLVITIIAASISKALPLWLGSPEEIQKDASLYFAVYGFSMPFYILVFLMTGMLQAIGNMRLPSVLNALMCILDAVLNVLFIKVLGLGVFGAALGTALSTVLIAVIMSVYTIFFCDYLKLKKSSWILAKNAENSTSNSFINSDGNYIAKAIKLGFPIAVEQVAFTGALVLVTKIIAPLGAISLAANSFAVTAEALCYMPGYGIQEASTTLVGQSVGAKRLDLSRSFSWITVIAGMSIMALMGILMFFLCPHVFKIFTKDEMIQSLATKVLRIECFAEPFYGAAIVSIGALRGRGDTLVPSILMLVSLWIVRIGLSLLLVKPLGLVGIWIAMAVELTFRGLLMVGRLTYVNAIKEKNVQKVQTDGK